MSLANCKISLCSLLTVKFVFCALFNSRLYRQPFRGVKFSRRHLVNYDNRSCYVIVVCACVMTAVGWFSASESRITAATCTQRS